MNAGQMIVGAAIGMVAGAALGVLFAPDKGSTTRKKLTQQGNRLLGAAKDSAGEYVENLEESLEGVRETAVDLKGKMKDALGAIAGQEPAKHPRHA